MRVTSEAYGTYPVARVVKGNKIVVEFVFSPKSSERLVRHARARIPNDVRVREGDYFVGSRAPQTQGQKEHKENRKEINRTFL